MSESSKNSIIAILIIVLAVISFLYLDSLETNTELRDELNQATSQAEDAADKADDAVYESEQAQDRADEAEAKLEDLEYELGY
jgi:sensor c-di-GMP phosphodiesterase-like protein